MGAGHDHGTAPHEFATDRGHRTRLWLAFGITATIVVAQGVGSVVTGSLALLTDTAHALTDASGLFLALVAANLMRRPANKRHTWGFRRIEVIAALAQATLLLVVGGYVAVEAITRFAQPPEVPAAELLVFGVIGLVANVVAIAILSSSRSSNFNMRAAFLEVVGDALGSLGVIVAAVVIATTGFRQADAIAALAIAALIIPRAVILMRQTTRVLMEFTPDGLDLDDVRRHLLQVDHVLDVHDLHASIVATGLPIMTAHIVVDDECFRDGHAAQVLADVRHCVADHFEVALAHSTFQLETQALAATESDSVRHP